MVARPTKPLHAIPLMLVAVSCGLVTAIIRYNTPEGSFGGLTDDHFFFVTQAWQMLFGELPDRDYFEPGVPLTLAVSAALQSWLGRGVWSEYVFCTAAIAAGAGITCYLAARASGSILLGFTAFLFQFALLPRLYSYPKILIYAIAIAIFWAWASSPNTRRTIGVGLVIAVAFLFRHDHGVYLTLGAVVAWGFTTGVAWRQKLLQLGWCIATVLVVLLPYLIYLQLNGGIMRHATTTYAWSARDFGRSPRVLPDFEWRPLFVEVQTDAPRSEWWEHAPFGALSEYSTFWLFWLFLVLPAVSLVMLIANPATGPPWPQERAKILSLVAIAFAVDYGFLRGNLAGRLADVAVPMCILAAWLLARLIDVAIYGRAEVFGRQRWVGVPLRALLGLAAAVLVVVTALVLVRPFRAAIENAKLLEGRESVESLARSVTQRLQHTWPLDSWADLSRADFALAKYLQTCTAPSDRVLVTEFRPQILGLAQRGFAAGHVDLRGGGFFGTTAEQDLLVERWRRQSVPIVIGPTRDSYRDWEENLPIVARYLNREYRNLGEQEVDGFKFLLFERRDARSVRVYSPLSLPCFR